MGSRLSHEIVLRFAQTSTCAKRILCINSLFHFNLVPAEKVPFSMCGSAAQWKPCWGKLAAPVTGGCSCLTKAALVFSSEKWGGKNGACSQLARKMCRISEQLPVLPGGFFFLSFHLFTTHSW